MRLCVADVCQALKHCAAKLKRLDQTWLACALTRVIGGISTVCTAPVGYDAVGHIMALLD
jgi:hypothetical protein